MKKKNKTRVNISWIPAHVGLKGNERVDALAKQATVDGLELDVEIPPEELTQIIKREFFSESGLKNIIITPKANISNKF